MQSIKTLFGRLEGLLYRALDAQLPVLHTAWQAASGVLLAGLIASRSTADVKLAIAAAIAVFLAALKATYLSLK